MLETVAEDTVTELLTALELVLETVVAKLKIMVYIYE
jgi:hypothetical protein